MLTTFPRRFAFSNFVTRKYNSHDKSGWPAVMRQEQFRTVVTIRHVNVFSPFLILKNLILYFNEFEGKKSDHIHNIIPS